MLYSQVNLSLFRFFPRAKAQRTRKRYSLLRDQITSQPHILRPVRSSLSCRKYMVRRRRRGYYKYEIHHFRILFKIQIHLSPSSYNHLHSYLLTYQRHLYRSSCTRGVGEKFENRIWIFDILESVSNLETHIPGRTLG